jgi:hypothetical protein
MELSPEVRFSSSGELDEFGVDLPDRLPVLDRGAHPPGAGKACAMEAASWLSGENWSDHPRSVHRAIASVARWVNDAVEAEERQRLWPLILASVGTGPSRGFFVDRRLRQLARNAGCRAAALGHPVDAWVAVLAEHRRLTGHEPLPVPTERIDELGTHLKALSSASAPSI